MPSSVSRFWKASVMKMATASISTCGEIPFASVKQLKLLKSVVQKETPVKLYLSELNPYITCGICMGYLYEASTITECMHTFCKSCIVKHTESRVTCPICDVIIHPTDPLSNVKLDRTLQDIVIKLVPSVGQEEKRRMEAFYKEHKQVKIEPAVKSPGVPFRKLKRGVKPGQGLKTKKVFVKSPKLKRKLKKSLKHMKPPVPRPPPLNIPLVSLVLECAQSYKDEDIEPLQKKFVRVQSNAKISNVLKFLRTKLNVPRDTEISMFCAAEKMTQETTLADIQRKYFIPDTELLCLSYAMSKTSLPVWTDCTHSENYNR